MSDTEGATAAQPVRVALMNDYEVVVAGLQKMLAPYADRVRVVELDSLLPVHSHVDVLLYDAFGRERVTGPVEQVITDTDAKVVIYTWHLDPELVREALDKGAVGCLSKTIDALDLVSALEKVHGGSVVVSDTEPRRRARGRDPRGGLARPRPRPECPRVRGAVPDRAGALQPGDRRPRVPVASTP